MLGGPAFFKGLPPLHGSMGCYLGWRERGLFLVTTAARQTPIACTQEGNCRRGKETRPSRRLRSLDWLTGFLAGDTRGTHTGELARRSGRNRNLCFTAAAGPSDARRGGR